MDIQVGEYVRTRGIIGKLIRIELDKIDTSLKWYVLDTGLNRDIDQIEYVVNKPYIEKHSKNIIDLIEAGDFVNGLEVDEFDYEEGTMLGIPIYTPDGLFNTLECYVPLTEIEIKEILTYEMYERNCYKVVE